MDNHSSLYLNNSTFNIRALPEPKIIIINPIDTTNSSQMSSVLYDSKQVNSQPVEHSKEQRRDWSHKPAEQWGEEQQQDDHSMRKLYKQLKKEEREKEQSEKQAQFLYVSSRGQEPQKEQPLCLQQQQIQSDEDQINQTSMVAYKNSDQILYSPIAKKLMLQCIVKIIPPAFFAMDKNIELYSLKQRKLLLKASKNKLPTSTQFTVLDSLHQQVAVFQSNLSRTQYKYFKPVQQSESQQQKQKQLQGSFASSLIKLSPVPVQISSLQSAEKCYIVFRSNLFGTKQERMKVVKAKGKVYKSNRFSDIKDSYQNFQYDRLQIFESKLAQRNKKGEFVLDFKAQNIVKSSKNMMIEDQNGDICLSFYKRKENIYCLNIIHPFNILEAFFIAISNLDHKFF